MSCNFARLASMKCSLMVLLQAVCLGELAHCPAIGSGAQTEHQFLPHRFGQRLAAVKHLVAAQPYFLVVGRAHARHPREDPVHELRVVVELARGAGVTRDDDVVHDLSEEAANLVHHLLGAVAGAALLAAVSASSRS